MVRKRRETDKWGGVEIPDRRKLTVGQSEKFFDEGAKIEPVTVKGKVLKDDWQLETVDREAELEKHKNDKMWPDKEKFLENFGWEGMKNEISEEEGAERGERFTETLKEIFWRFRNNFWNGDWKNWETAKFREFEIELIDNYQPKIDKYRRLTDEKTKILEAWVKDLLEGGVIEKVKGEVEFAANPHIIIQKKVGPGGSMTYKNRIVFDYRNQNQVIKSVSYPLKLMDELIEKAAKSGKWFMSFDLCNYFYMLPLEQKSRKVTAFYALGEIYQFLNCSMGLRTIPSNSQRCTNLLVSHMKQSLIAYIDNFLNYTIIRNVFRCY